MILADPDGESSLRYLLRLPIGGGLVFRTAGTWPRTKALFCFPMPPEAWPDEGEVVERVPLRSCARRGAAIEILADRARENRSEPTLQRCVLARCRSFAGFAAGGALAAAGAVRSPHNEGI